MVNMLIRTSRVCKYRLAIFIRVLFFFGIPILYLTSNNQVEDDKVLDDFYIGNFQTIYANN